MNPSISQVEPAFGFLTILEDSTVGLLGGYLVINRRGRPLEFHCTAPVVASRAEEILFGPTLRPHLYCERIGAALLAKATVAPQLVVVNQLDCWPLAEETSLPVVMVDPRPSQSAAVSPASTPTAGMACLDQIDPARRPETERLLQELTQYICLSEPFERITEAIREAGLSGSTDGESQADEVAHDQAA